MAMPPKKTGKPKKTGNPNKTGNPEKAPKPGVPKSADMPFDMDSPAFRAIEEMLKDGGFGDLMEAADTPQELIEEFLELGSDEGDESGVHFGALVDVLSDLRVEANSGNREARREAEDLRAWLEQHLHKVEVTSRQLMALGHAFAEAGLDPGSSLRDAIARQLEVDRADGHDETESFDALLDSFADEIDGDPLAQYETLSNLLHYMPDETRLGLAEILATNIRPELREISLGFLLTGDERMIGAVCDGLIASANQGAQPARLLMRLRLVRELVALELRGRIDSAIAVLGPLATPPARETPPKLNVLFGAMPDGAGTSTIVAQLGKGRSGLMASMLFKAGQGLVEINILEGISKTSLRKLFADSEIREYPASIAYVAARLSAALAENRESGTPVPPLILTVMELLDLSTLPAQGYAPDALFDEILAIASLDASRPENQRTAFNKLLGEGIFHYWFECSDEIDALLRKIRPRGERLEALLTGYLPTRRWFWIEQCAWTAALLREQQGRDGQLAQWAAVLGKQLCGNGPLAESPLMQEVAEGTIKAFTLQ